ncbi:uncharacterized protein Dvir_GJ25806 [Drosophila virilis]|uniref:Uncharacterized protein n=1 Tax=Drosophila virilis TaxID=7244 RepID=A0A0Q9WRR5_DROVI|nr:uncharacterized protein Dvir_GJ25806 [Drosophila virilis]
MIRTKINQFKEVKVKVFKVADSSRGKELDKSTAHQFAHLCRMLGT